MAHAPIYYLTILGTVFHKRFSECYFMCTTWNSFVLFYSLIVWLPVLRMFASLLFSFLFFSLSIFFFFFASSFSRHCRLWRIAMVCFIFYSAVTKRIYELLDENVFVLILVVRCYCGPFVCGKKYGKCYIFPFLCLNCAHCARHRIE